uniref:Uncharacterized protein n=1 Tax=Rhizophora mucronata TaxID=61149 RepID=A0A2P2P4V4_RHIMU
MTQGGVGHWASWIFFLFSQALIPICYRKTHGSNQMKKKITPEFYVVRSM